MEPDLDENLLSILVVDIVLQSDQLVNIDQLKKKIVLKTEQC